MEKKADRILITGGAGFLGSHLSEALLTNNADIICTDNFFSGSKDNIRHLFQHPYFELIRHDVTHPFFAEVDKIYHLACPASPIYYQYNAIKTIKTSVLGTIHMLGLAKRTQARILLASTSEVYGDPEVHPQAEWRSPHGDETRRPSRLRRHGLSLCERAAGGGCRPLFA